jgi:hypothetical protein
VFSDSSTRIYLSFYTLFNGYCGELFVINFIIIVLPRFRASLLAVNNLLI